VPKRTNRGSVLRSSATSTVAGLAQNLGAQKGHGVGLSGDAVLLLGAGFSRAASSHMPLTDELGDAVVRALDLAEDARTPERFTSGSFETWLSHLADEQPF
jgi:hypothetical protein